MNAVSVEARMLAAGHLEKMLNAEPLKQEWRGVEILRYAVRLAPKGGPKPSPALAGAIRLWLAFLEEKPEGPASTAMLRDFISYLRTA